MSLQVELLEASFAELRPHMDGFGARFYATLFAACPQARPLFADTDMARQEAMLAQTLAVAVASLRRPDELAAALRTLGARHLDYGATAEHYPIVGDALLATLAQSLGEAWTAEVRRAWVDAYGAIARLMLEGAEQRRATAQGGTDRAQRA